jgi:TPR repeat protein
MNAQNGLHGVPKDEKVAQEYWEWASERGHALSQYMLSMLLLRVGFDNDPLRKESKMEWSTRIVSLLKESADRGLDLSQHSLAQTYRYGYHGVAKNESIATKYYIAAARQGYTKSIEALLEKVI